MGCNFSERSQKKDGEKKMPKEKVITRGEQQIEKNNHTTKPDEK